MNHTAFFEQVKKGNIQPVYLMEGTEEYIKQQAVRQLCTKLLPAGLEELNLTDLTDPEADALIAAAETLPFMADRRIVIIRECSLLTAGKKAENEDKAAQIAEYVERIPPTACVVFFVKGKADGRKKLYTLLKKKNAIVDFSPMSDAECADWARRTMARMGKQMTPRTADKLVFTVGRDAALLKQEMEKLAAYLADRPEVTEADIDAICTRSTECTVFQMVDAQVAGRNDVAFGLLKDMVRAGEDRIGILAMLLRQYRILYHMRSLMDERAPQQSQASLLGIPPFAVSRTQQQARRIGRVIDAIWNQYPRFTELEVRSHLARFGYRGEEVFKDCASLSGGELARLRFAELALERPNLMFLDEPTNHLDIYMRESLTQALAAYTGTLLLVTHDRYLMQTLGCPILYLEDGKATFYPNFAALQNRDNGKTQEQQKAEDTVKKQAYGKEQRKRRAEVRARIKAVENQIEELGAHIVELENEINDPEVLRDHLLLRDKCDELDDTRFHQQELYDEWEKLAEEQETFENEGE